MTYLYELPSDVEPQPKPPSTHAILRQVADMLRDLKRASPEELRFWALSSEPINNARMLERIVNDAETQEAIIRGQTDYWVRVGTVVRIPRDMPKVGGRAR